MASNKSKVVNPVTHVLCRQVNASRLWRPNESLIRNRLASASTLYRKDLYSHFGCVNAIEFSKDGQWLLSGGDDKRVLLWNVEKAISKHGSPTAMKTEHTSNIFCMGFDSTNSRLFSAGNDQHLMVHDCLTGENVHTVFHDEAIYGLSIDPTNDDILATACNDGGAFIYDLREAANHQTDAVLTIQSHAPFHAIMHNPIECRLLTTANTREGVGLWDIRKIREPVIKYTDSANDLQPAMSVRFNIRGTQILALRRRHSAILYNLSSHFPIAEFDDSTYYNSCTMKSCCFAGDDDQYILSGSDDFKLYAWKIPQELMDSPLSTPKKAHFINEAHMRLVGHRSIVNQVRYNYTNSMIASSGVEKIIKLWSSFPFAGEKESLDTTETSSSFSSTNGIRRVYSHEDYISLVLHSGQFMSHDYSHQSTQEDPRMMAFFDSLVQRDIEGWTSDSDSDSTEGYTLMTLRSSSSSASSDSEAIDNVLNAQTESYMHSLLNRIDGQSNENTLVNCPLCGSSSTNATTTAAAATSDQSTCTCSNSVQIVNCTEGNHASCSNEQGSCSPSPEPSSRWAKLKIFSGNNGKNTSSTQASSSAVASTSASTVNASSPGNIINVEENKIVNLISGKKVEQLKKTARIVVRSTKRRLKKVKKYCKNAADEKTAQSSSQRDKSFRFQNMNKLTELLTKRLEQSSNKSFDQSKNKRSKSRRRLRRLTTQSDFILNEVYPGDQSNSSSNNNDSDSDSDVGLPDDLLAPALVRGSVMDFDDDSDTSTSPSMTSDDDDDDDDDDDETISSDDESKGSREDNNLITFGDANEATTSNISDVKAQQQQSTSRCPPNSKFEIVKETVSHNNASENLPQIRQEASKNAGEDVLMVDMVVHPPNYNCELSNSFVEKLPGASFSPSSSSSSSTSSSASSSTNSSSSSSSSSSTNTAASACSVDCERITNNTLIASQSLQPSSHTEAGERTLLSSQH